MARSREFAQAIDQAYREVIGNRELSTELESAAQTSFSRILHGIAGGAFVELGGFGLLYSLLQLTQVPQEMMQSGGVLIAVGTIIGVRHGLKRGEYWQYRRLQKKKN